MIYTYFVLKRVAALVAVLLLTGLRESQQNAALILAGEPVQFDAAARPAFSAVQLRNSFDATRSGLQRWAATDEGQRIMHRFDPKEFRVIVEEDPNEGGAGRAPQPGIATLIAANDHSKMKVYTLILNPTYGVSRGVIAVPGHPATPSDLMAIAWAGEMLHISYYARGISLPHHQRPDFQSEWHEVAAELGYPAMPHADPSEAQPARPRLIIWR